MGILILDDDHVYTMDGVVIPGVTTIMQPIIDYGFIEPDVLERKSRLGTYVHAATEMIDDNTLDYENLNDELKPYVNAWIKFKKDTNFEIELSEHLVFHHRYHYAGMLDRIGLLNGERVLIDIKCTSVLEPHVGIQLSAYLEAANEMSRQAKKIKKRFALQLKPTGKYNLKPYSDKIDFKMFMSLLTINNWKLKHAK